MKLNFKSTSFALKCKINQHLKILKISKNTKNIFKTVFCLEKERSYENQINWFLTMIPT